MANIVYIENYEEEIIAPDRINLRLRIRFFEGVLLSVNEAVIVDGTSLVHLDYRYHCQNAENALIFRYDSTPHFPDLPTFPHHKHIGEQVIASGKPMLIDVFLEAKQTLTHDFEG